MLQRRTASGLAVVALLGGCTEVEVRCREGYRRAGEGGEAVCVLADAGAVATEAGTLDAGTTDAGPSMDACNPGAADPAGDGVDGNCDGVDGLRADAIFVSTDGADTNTGLDPSQPVRTVSAALAVAQGTTRRTILVAVGTYDATAVSVGDAGAAGMIASHRLVDGVTIAGRYPGGAAGWTSHATDGARRSVLRGQLAAAFSIGQRTGVTFSDVDLVSELAPPLPGLSCYGLLLSGSGQVTLNRVRVQACRGPDGPTMAGETPGAGTRGAEGASAGSGGQGGVGCRGETGRGGASIATQAGEAGRAGSMTREGAAPVGGAGGTAGGVAGAGAGGPSGGAGRFSALGTFTDEGYDVGHAEAGETGGTGGGGGGGHSPGAADRGGGGGGGGCGGPGGEGGRYGGASIGVYAWGDGVRVSLTDVSIETLGGGNGQPGGEGGEGGAGGAGGAGSGSGGSGGRGGDGGRGGRGAPGAGGPSLGVVARTGTVVDMTGVSWSVGDGGMPGAGSIGLARALQTNVHFVPR